jgi:cell division protein FtsZ
VIDNTVNKADGSVDYKKLDRPTVMRGSNAQPAHQTTPDTNNSKDMDYLDIPAFLRRQAD